MKALRLTFPTFLILITAFAARGADPYSLIDLSVETDDFSRYYGSDSAGFRGGSKGVPVCGGFDCDGDQINDMAFAQIQASPMGRTKAGEITFIFGNRSIGEKKDTVGFPERMLKIAGDQNHEIAGAEIWMEDVNGDGLGDLLIGRQNYTKGDRVGAGALTIIFGHPIMRTWSESGTYLDLGNLPTDQGNGIVTIVGAAAGDRLGIWMRAADVNGDGISDLVVGADQISSATEEHLGGVYVIQGGAHLASVGGEIDLMDFGEATFPEAVQTKVALVVPPSGTSHYHFGATLNVGDLDGNGRSEVLASAALNRAGAVLGPNGDRSDGFGGSVDGTLFIAWDENFPPGPWPHGYTFTVTEPLLGDFTRIDGESANRSFGEEILSGEDYSGDSFPELFVGDLVGTSPNGTHSGLGYVFYNAAKLRGRSFNMNAPPADVKLTKIYGPIAGAIGADTMAHGDFDADGIADLACGNPHDAPQARNGAGSVHVFYGQPGGWSEIIDLKEGNLPGIADMRIVQIDGGAAEDTLCYSASAGLIDDDDHVDLIINEMTGNGLSETAVDVGNMVILSGSGMGSAPASTLSFWDNADLERRTLSFGNVGLGESVRRYPIIQSSTLMVPDFDAVSLVGPEAGDYFIGAQAKVGSIYVVEVIFTPTSSGPHGAALVLESSGEVEPLRLGLTGIGLVPSSIEADFVDVGESSLLKFGGDFGAEYELLSKETLEASMWDSVQTNVRGTGGWIYLRDALVSPTTQRKFYKVRRQ